MAATSSRVLLAPSGARRGAAAPSSQTLNALKSSARCRGHNKPGMHLKSLLLALAGGTLLSAAAACLAFSDAPQLLPPAKMDVAGGSLVHTEEPAATARDQCILMTSAATAAHWSPRPSCVPDTRRSLCCRERCYSTVPTDLSSLALCTCNSHDDFDTLPLEPAASPPDAQPSTLPWTDALNCDFAPAAPLLDAVDRLSGHPATPQHSLPAMTPVPEPRDGRDGRRQETIDFSNPQKVKYTGESLVRKFFAAPRRRTTRSCSLEQCSQP